VADFVGKMNFVDATVRESNCGICVLDTAANATIVVPATAFTGPAAAGQRVLAALRPEQLTLARPGDGLQHCVQGTLETTIFVGSLQVFLVRAFGTLLQVHLLAAGEGFPFRDGDQVLVAYKPEQVQVFMV